MTELDDLPTILTYSQLCNHEPGTKVWIPSRVLDDGTGRGAVVEIVEFHDVELE